MIDYHDTPVPRRSMYAVEKHCNGHSHIRVDFPARIIIVDPVVHGIIIALLRLADDDAEAGINIAQRIAKMKEGDCLEISGSYGDYN